MSKVWLRLSLALALGVSLMAFQNCTTNLDSPGQESNSSQSFQVTINKKPATITAVGDATFEFASSDPNATFECSAFGRGFGTCFSPLELKALEDGPYTLEIRAVSSSGVRSAPFRYDWQVNRKALSASVTSSMPAFTNLRTATVTFTGSSSLGTLTGFECKLNALEYQPCTSPFNLTNLVDGDQVLQVRSRESSGQVSQPSVLSWKVDTAMPFVSITGGPSGDAYVPDYGQTAAFTFNATDAGLAGISGVFCRLDTQAETACTTTASYSLNADNAAHTFTVRAVDRAGNSRTVSRTFTFFYSPPADPGGGG